MSGSGTAEITRPVVLALLAITVLAAVLRAISLNSPLWFDEIAMLVLSMRADLADMISTFQSNNNHPLYSFIAKLSFLALGEAPWTFRLPAAIFGTLAVPALFLFARRITSVPEALAAALLLAVAYHSVWFSQNARAYSFILLAAIVCTHALHRALTSPEGRALNLSVYAAMAGLAAYAHVTSVLIVVAHAVVVLGYYLIARRDRLVSLEFGWLVFTFMAAAAITVLLYAPMIDDVMAFFVAGAKTEHNVVSARVGNESAMVASVIFEFTQAFGGIVPTLAVLALLVVGGIGLCRTQPLAAALVLAPIPVVILASQVLGRSIHPRFMYFVIGFLAVAVTHGAWIVSSAAARAAGRPQLESRAFALIAGIVALLSAWNLPANYTIPKQDYASAVEIVRSRHAGLDPYVIGITSEIPVNQYLGAGFGRITSPEQLTDLLDGDRPFVLVYTFTRYIAAGSPEMWGIVEQSCREADRVPSTVRAGEIVVALCGGTEGG